MKKLFITTLIIIFAGLVIFYFTRSSSIFLDPDKSAKQSENFRPDPSNATYVYDDGSYTLSNGRAETSSGEEIMLLEEQNAYGDINADGRDDTVLFLVRMGGGSGVFVHVGAYVSGPVNYNGTNTIFLGDRIAPQSASIANGVITVRYLDRQEDQPFSVEPTIPTSRVFVFENGELVER